MRKPGMRIGWLLSILMLGCTGVKPSPLPTATPSPSGMASPELPSALPSPSPSSSPSSEPLPTPSASVLPTPLPSTLITELTPAELREKKIRYMTVDQGAPPGFSFFSYANPQQQGVYRFAEGREVTFVALEASDASPRVWEDQIYYLKKNCVKRFSLQEGITTEIAGTCDIADYGFRDGLRTQALFNGASALALDSSGGLYISDTFNFRIRRLEGETVSTYAGNWIGTDHPTRGLNYGCDAGVCVAGTLFDPIDRIMYFIQGEPAGMPIQPSFQATDVDHRENPTRVVSLLQDGARDKATFWQPGKLDFDALGNLYVRDGIVFQEQIRRIAPDGKVKTVVTNSNTPDPLNRSKENYYPQAEHTLEPLASGLNDHLLDFAVSGTRLYVLAQHLYGLDLLTGAWKILLTGEELAPYLAIPGDDHPITVRSLAADSQGNLYLHVSKPEAEGIRNKILKIRLRDGLFGSLGSASGRRPR